MLTSNHAPMLGRLSPAYGHREVTARGYARRRPWADRAFTRTLKRRDAQAWRDAVADLFAHDAQAPEPMLPVPETAATKLAERIDGIDERIEQQAEADLLAEYGVTSYADLLDAIDADAATSGDDLDDWEPAPGDLTDTAAVYGHDFDPDECIWGFSVSARPVGSHGGNPPAGRSRDAAGRWLAAQAQAAA